MIIIPIIPFRRHRKRRSDPPAPPAPLVLVSASLGTGAHPTVRLVFDREVDISAFNPAAIVVDDATTTHHRFVATIAVMLDPNTLRVSLRTTGSATGTGTTMNAGADNEIVAADDGGTWAGATNLLLPYP